MANRFKYLGRSAAAPDAISKVTGTLVYSSDLRLPGMVHAQLVLSPHAHAKVLAIDASRALSVPGVLGVFSHLNSPSTLYCRYRIVPGQAGCIADESLFASTARCAGDRVAAVVATTPAAARTAARLLHIEYLPLPPVLSAAAALAPGAPALHPRGNLLHEFETAAGVAGPVPDGSVTTRARVSTQMLHHAAIEPHACIASVDASDKLTIWSACQSVYGARTVVADLLGRPYHTVHVIKVPMGGSFGGKQEYILEPVTAYLATQIRRPVSLVLDREECIRATMVRPEQQSAVESLVTRDGELLELHVDTLLNAGAYATSSPDYAEAMAHKLTRLYRMRRYRHHGRVAYTTMPVAGGLRGWGAPEIATCAEIHLDEVARRLGMDPVQLRLRNLVHPGDIDPVTGRSVGDARVRQCLQLGAEAFGWRERFARSPGSGRLRRAVGVACGAHKNGLLSDSFPESSTMTLKMNEDGSLHLNAAIHENGAGGTVTMRMIVAEVLDVAPESITVAEADSEASPFDFGCFGSRVTYVCGANACAVAKQLRGQLLSAAAELLGVPASSLAATEGKVRAAGEVSGGLPYAEIVQQARMRYGRDIVATNTYVGASNPGSYSVQFAEVEVDRLTGLARVTDFLTVVDIGRAINRAMVEGQCRGAVQAGIGSALCEEVAVDADGRVAPGGFRNYHLVNSPDMPPVRVMLIEHDGDDGPFGAKSVGEIAAVPTAAAIVNALNRALGSCITELPVTPERILAALAGDTAVPTRDPTCG
jgi:xanthine dehydrogenase molybdenum-binding subunit